MKKYLRWSAILVVVLTFAIPSYAQRDLIILRDGIVHENVKVLATTTDSTFYQQKVGKKMVETSIGNEMIYLIKYQKRGNVYFTLDREQFSGDVGSSMPNDATAIYLLEGRELWGYNLITSKDEVTFQTGKKKKSQM